MRASFIVACVVAGAVWWLWPAKPAPDVTVARVEQVTPPPAPLPEMMRPTDPAPVEPLPASASAVLTALNPQAQLSTLIPRLGQVLQLGDMDAWMVLVIPAADLATKPEAEKAQWVAAMQNPSKSEQQARQQLLYALQFIQNTVPSYDETGTKATYALPPGYHSDALLFKKIDGRWYPNGWSHN